MGRLGEGETPTTTTGIVTFSGAGGVLGIAREGAVYEAIDTFSLAPVVGDNVLLDYLPASRQWVVVAIVV